MRWMIIAAVVLASCRSTASLSQREIAEISARSGSVSAEFLEDPTAPGVELGPGEEFTRPQLMPGNPKPEYPAALVSRNLPPHVVAVRVTFGEDGRATRIADSPLASSTAGQYTSHFADEVEETLNTWKCWPAEIRKFRVGEDLDGDGKPDYRILVARKLLKTYFDLAFSFELVDGQPVVKRTR